MQSSSGNEQEAPSTQVSAASFPLPCFLDSESVAEKISSGPVHHTTKERSGAVETSISASQHRHSLANEHNQLAVRPGGDGVSVMAGSANASLSGLRNQPGSGTTHVGAASLAGGQSSSSALPLLPSSAISYSAPSPAEPVPSPAWHHALVVFDKLFCVCYVPPKVRSITQVGELVLCEFGGSENVATVVADVSSLVADIVARREAVQPNTSLDAVFAPPVERGMSTTSPGSSHSSASCTGYPPLHHEAPSSGRANEHALRRLPCVLRRGTNRDKKRVYFSRLRSSDALVVAQRLLSGEQVVAVSAEYQVNFACANIYLAGERDQCTLTDQQFQQLGNAMLEPLRCDVVEFRFWSERCHGELDLTRGLIGKEHSEMLHDMVVEHLRAPVGKTSQSAPRAAGQTGGSRQLPAVQQPPPPPPLSHPQQLAVANNPGAAAMMINQGFAYPSATAWAHATAAMHPMTTVPTVTVLQPAAATAPPPGVGYALRPSLYMAPLSSQHPSMQPLSSPPPVPMMRPSHFQPMPHIGGSTGAYLANPPSSPFFNHPQGAPQPQQLQQQQQQQTLALSSGSVGGAPVYYVMPSATAVQWDRSQHAVPMVEQMQPQHYLQQLSPSTPPNVTHMGPTFLQSSDTITAQQPQQQQQQQQQQGSTSATYIPASTVNVQGYRTVSYPMVFNNVTYNPFQH